MTRLADRPEDGCCEGCWDARPVPGLEREYYLCDYHGSPDYGHVVHYRHCCECFSAGGRGEEQFLTPAPARGEAGVTPEPDNMTGQAEGGNPSDIDSVRPVDGMAIEIGGFPLNLPAWRSKIRRIKEMVSRTRELLKYLKEGGWHGYYE